MEIRVKCVDARFSKRQGRHRLKLNKVYTVVRFHPEKPVEPGRWIWMKGDLMVELKEIAKSQYLSRRI